MRMMEYKDYGLIVFYNLEINPSVKWILGIKKNYSVVIY